ncbi:MAG: isochorismatase [Frankiales bacterium]|nr:isochorismatase [Frankiales bacterium]
MSTLENRSATALLVIDVQVGVVAEALDRDAVVTNIAGLVERARASDVPVVWVQHSDDGLLEGSPQWEYVPELAIGDGEAVVHKRWGDAFEETDLEQVLASAGVGRLVVTGAQSDACIRSTLHGLVARGYDAILVSDAHTTEDLSQWGGPAPELAIAFTNFYWENTAAPGREIGVVTTASVAFA